MYPLWGVQQECCDIISSLALFVLGAAEYSHGEAVSHKGNRDRADIHCNIIRNRWSLIQTAQFIDSPNGFLLAPGSPAREHLQNHASERPDIDFCRVALALRPNNFGRHPENRSLHGVRCIVTVDIVCLFGDSEI